MRLIFVGTASLSTFFILISSEGRKCDFFVRHNGDKGCQFNTMRLDCWYGHCVFCHKDCKFPYHPTLCFFVTKIANSIQCVWIVGMDIVFFVTKIAHLHTIPHFHPTPNFHAMSDFHTMCDFNTIQNVNTMHGVFDGWY